MNLSVIFSKLKLLFPVAVVASSIVITVKLLTSETPSTSEILKVEAKEDIHVTNFKDDLVIPEEPPEEVPPEENQPKPTEPTKDEETDDKEKQDIKPEDTSAEENKQSDSELEDQSKKKDEEKDQQKPKARKFNPNNPLSSMLSKILGNKDK